MLNVENSVYANGMWLCARNKHTSGLNQLIPADLNKCKLIEGAREWWRLVCASSQPQDSKAYPTPGNHFWWENDVREEIETCCTFSMETICLSQQQAFYAKFWFFWIQCYELISNAAVVYRHLKPPCQHHSESSLLCIIFLSPQKCLKLKSKSCQWETKNYTSRSTGTKKKSQALEQVKVILFAHKWVSDVEGLLFQTDC